jgi:opacity protein-like surface antigen
MRFKMIAVAVSLLCLVAVPAFAADVTGTWVAEMAAPKGGPGGGPGGAPGGGPMKFTFNLKAEGSSLSGTVVGPMGNENEIVDGKIDNDNVSFAVKIDRMGNEMKINYKGTVSGDEMKLTYSMEGGMGGPPGGGSMPSRELVAKRQIQAK